ncbi:kinase-like protein [Corynespora cassiicola Philippines]|uniref:Kinase-like protein n=1 Tax=Corynespora cassiicola Philippines TaxID=1448308 RepID=A0A2T2NWE4_CORCC|nr:kinase-like protein [Corynespora cassiicola Philippines]
MNGNNEQEMNGNNETINDNPLILDGEIIIEEPEQIDVTFPDKRNAKVLRMTGTGLMIEYPYRPGQILKNAWPCDPWLHALEIEKTVYRRLGSHPNLARVAEITDYGIYFEKEELGDLRTYYEGGGEATLSEKVKWCYDLCQVVQYVHEHNIRHADLNGRNFLISSSRNIVLCDFAGSSIDGKPAVTLGEPGYRHPDRELARGPTMRSEIHSLGSSIYEIVKGERTYPQFDSINEKGLITKEIQAGNYPDVTNLTLRDIISKCWNGSYESAGEVAEAIANSDVYRQFHATK